MSLSGMVGALTNDQKMLVKQIGSCQKCNKGFGLLDSIQSTNVTCSKCTRARVLCRPCKQGGCECGGDFLNFYDKNPDVLFWHKCIVHVYKATCQKCIYLFIYSNKLLWKKVSLHGHTRVAKAWPHACWSIKSIYIFKNKMELNDYNWPLALPNGYFYGRPVPGYHEYLFEYHVHYMRYIFFMCVMNADGEYPMELGIDDLRNGLRSSQGNSCFPRIKKILIGEAPPPNPLNYFYNSS
jgi:hypothetical protein